MSNPLRPGSANRRRLAALLFGLAIILLTGFAGWSHVVNGRQVLEESDRAIQERLYAHAQQNTVPRLALRTITQLGDARLLVTLSVVGFVGLLIRRRWREAMVWLLGTLMGFLVIHILKEHFGRARPDLDQPIVIEASRSFPSFHAAGSLMFYGLIAGWMVRTKQPRSGFVVIAVTALVGVIGFSRAYLGAHWPSDVTGGFILGAAWLFLSMAVAESIRANGDE